MNNRERIFISLETLSNTMSRSFGDNLSKNDERVMADVRRNIWTSGFKGLGYGSAFGFIGYAFSSFVYNRLDDARKKKIPIHFNRNTAFFTVMCSGALGSFLMSTTTGKNSVHEMHPIFEIGKSDKLTPYQKAYEESQKLDDDIDVYRQRLISRRKTIKNRMDSQHGLSDSHGGKWDPSDEENDEYQQRKVDRRQALKKRFTRDSHGDF